MGIFLKIILTLTNRYLHTLFVALDANFRLKRKNVSNSTADPGLIRGAAYFVEETMYKKHLEEYTDEKEPVSSLIHMSSYTLT